MIYSNPATSLYLLQISSLTLDQQYMHRCLELAKLGAGYVAPNPMVGAVVVHKGQIIGEGYHQRYGEAHAEVHAIGQVIQNGHADLLPASTIYVSLEPCAHFGKTPPCADLIIRHRIPQVIIGCRDPFEQVNGKGIEKLRAAGIDVLVDVLEKECNELNKRFFTFHEQRRPYIILKWAQTADGFIAYSNKSGNNSDESGKGRLLISNDYSNRIVHKWRSEEAGILVGTVTALTDDPELTTRLWTGHSPVRLVIDRHLRLPHSLKLFSGNVKTIIFNIVKQEESGNLLYYQLKEDANLLPQLLNALYELRIQSVLVEGGSSLLQSFIDGGVWDEARVISNEQLTIGEGLPAPQIRNGFLQAEQKIFSDSIKIYAS